MGWLDAIFGSPKATVEPAPRLASYPSDDDARFARVSGFGYGTATDPYVQGDVGRVFGSFAPGGRGKPPAFLPASAAGLSVGEATTPELSATLDLSNPRNAAMKEKMGLLFARAALAANRSPVAALGFDPRRAQIDTEIGPSTIGGAYSKARDAMYATANDPSAIVHESMHRGFGMLRDLPELADAFSAMPREESMVRYLMAKQAGDPEAAGGPIDKRQREEGLMTMDQRSRQEALKKIEAAAQRLIYERQPRGPR